MADLTPEKRASWRADILRSNALVDSGAIRVMGVATIAHSQNQDLLALLDALNAKERELAEEKESSDYLLREKEKWEIWSVMQLNTDTDLIDQEHRDAATKALAEAKHDIWDCGYEAAQNDCSPFREPGPMSTNPYRKNPTP